MPFDVVLYGVSDDPADNNVYPVQGRIVNGRCQQFSSQATVTGFGIPNVFLYFTGTGAIGGPGTLALALNTALSSGYDASQNGHLCICTVMADPPQTDVGNQVHALIYADEGVSPQPVALPMTNLYGLQQIHHVTYTQPLVMDAHPENWFVRVINTAAAPTALNTWNLYVWCYYV